MKILSFVIRKAVTTLLVILQSVINVRMRDDQFNHGNKLTQQIILYALLFEYL